jgi:Flp pilus assembly pilin Flp
MLTAMSWLAWLRGWMGDERAQGLVEYALIIALVSIALVAGLGYLTGALKGTFSSICTTLGGTTC